jgi:transcriptional regulator with XRE-family HTH domain
MYMHSGRTLKMLRQFNNLTQQQIAKRLGISQQAYSKLEQHQSIGKKKMDAILNSLNFSRSDLDQIKKILAK